MRAVCERRCLIVTEGGRNVAIGQYSDPDEGELAAITEKVDRLALLAGSWPRKGAIIGRSHHCRC